MSATATSYKIEPLNGDNYLAWRRRIEWILDDLDLWTVANGTERLPVPADPTAATPAELANIAEWKRRDKKARKEICLRVSDEYLVYIDQVTTAPELWATLQTIFESKATVGITLLWRELFRTVAKDGANMEEHIRKLRGLYLQINA